MFCKPTQIVYIVGVVLYTNNSLYPLLPHTHTQAAVEATFTAVNNGAPSAQLEPVGKSFLAKRRHHKKSSTSS